MSASELFSRETFEFVVDSYRNAVGALLDDPDADAKSDYVRFKRIGKEIGLDFWEVAKEEATEYERLRLREIVGTS